MKKILLLIVGAILLSGSLFAESGEAGERVKVNPNDNRLSPMSTGIADFEPAKINEIEEGTSICIKTDVFGVDVFLNGIYEGRTDLIIEGLLPGFYHLELRKVGYETEHFVICVRKGYNLDYYVQMRRIFGTIRVRDVPAGASVSVTNSLSTQWLLSSKEKRECEIKVEPGLQEVVVRKFGYETFDELVSVFPYSYSTIYVELKPAEFRLSMLECNKKSFNPMFKGRLGQCVFSFEVTAAGEECGVVSITDVFGNEVYKKVLPVFTDWGQEFVWDGKSQDGRVLGDGEYTCTVTASGLSQSVRVLLDSTISYPLFGVTKVGGGIGTVPVVFKENSGFSMLNFAGGAEITGLAGDGKGEAEGTAVLEGGALFNFGEHYEIGFHVQGFPGKLYDDSFCVNASLKLYTNFEANNGNFCLGGLIRYGMFTGEGYRKPYGVDNGCGLGAGFLFGYDFGALYFGWATQFIGGAATGRLSDKDIVLNNALCVSVKPVQSVRLSIYGTLDSAFGLPQLPNSVDFIHGTNFGFELDFMPESSAFIISTKMDAMVIRPDSVYLNAGIGLSYLF